MLTGGGVERVSAPTIGADAAALVMHDLGIGDDGRLLLEREARDTWENAAKSKALAGSEARRALAAGDFGLAHAASHGGFSHRAGLSGRAMARGLPDGRLGETPCGSFPFESPAEGLAADSTWPSTNGWGFSPTVCPVVATMFSRTAELPTVNFRPAVGVATSFGVHAGATPSYPFSVIAPS